MNGNILFLVKRLLFSLLILLGISTISLYSQPDTIINKYAKVLTRNDYEVIVDDASPFSVGDYVLIIQMKGVSINADNAAGYGDIAGLVGTPGQYEFLIINSITSNTIGFLSKIKKYDPSAYVQLIRVPFYNSISFTNKVTCEKWDSVKGTGGVVAMMVGKTLTLNADIDVSGKGFIGGLAEAGDGLCAEPSSIADIYSFSSSFTNAGYKGEGIASHYTPGILIPPVILPHGLKGRGVLFSGGGGGNGRFSGGGGGANRGRGGVGGIEDILCNSFPSTSQAGGDQGFKVEPRIDTASNTGGVFMGGGGGSSTYLSGAAATDGGNGGGIVFILADTIVGNGYSIRASGDSARTATGIFSGAGGGGAGGSIIIFAQDYSSSNLNLKVNGEKGGDVYHDFATTNGGGVGGPGGGGYIALLKPLTLNVSSDIQGGGVSYINYSGRPSESVSNIIDPGLVRAGVNPVLTGFLFNSIYSSVTADQIDSVCSNMPVPRLIGTKPVGGLPSYNYLWQKSYDQISWSDLYDGPDSINYTHDIIETDTLYFRRTITDSSLPIPIADTSKPVKIIVQPFIKNNIVGTSDTICFAQDPVAFTSIAALQDGNGIYSFYWEVSMEPDSAGFGLPLNANNTESYTPPPALETTSWYRRTVISGRCIDSSATAVAKITVLPLISNNTITSLPEEICFGSTFTDLLATDVPTLGGGDDTYKFRWESNINNSGWGIAPGTSDQVGYNPGELPERIPSNEYHFRRVVISGAHDVCVNTSDSIVLKDYPVITNNSLLPLVQTIGFDTIPSQIIGTDPQNGDGTYSYVWEMMTVSPTWTGATGMGDQKDYSPPALQDTTWYRRTVNSSACTDISNVVVVNVHDEIINNSVSFVSGAVEDTICYGSIPGLIKGSTVSGGAGTAEGYAYKWYTSATGGNPDSEWTEITGATSIDYQPVALTQEPSYFRRKVFSPSAAPTAFSTSNTIKLTVLPLITNSITGSDTICYGTIPALLQTNVLGGGDGTYSFRWIDSTDASGWTGSEILGEVLEEYQPPQLYVQTRYKRIVTSGSNDACIDTSASVVINIHDLPTVAITNTNDTTLCTDSKVQLKLKLTGRAGYTIDYNDGLAPDVTGIPVPADIGLIEVTPASPLASNSYTYTITRVVDKNGCDATSFTGEKKALVYQKPDADAGPDEIICGQTVTLNATPTVGAGTWSYPLQVVAASVNAPSVTVTVDSLYTGSSISHLFYWEEVNWQCKSKDSVQITFDKRINTINGGRDTSLYSFDNIYQMTGDPVLTIGQGMWSTITGSGTPDDPSNGATILRGLSGGLNTFLWTVTNGDCDNTDLVNIEVYELFIPEGFSPNNDPDDYNNKFIITGLDLNNQIVDLTILNSAGVRVFSTSNRQGNEYWVDWDGKTSGGADLPEGTYYYLIEITSTISTEGQVFKESGFVVLKRY